MMLLLDFGSPLCCLSVYLSILSQPFRSRCVCLSISSLLSLRAEAFGFLNSGALSVLSYPVLSCPVLSWEGKGRERKGRQGERRSVVW